MPSTPPPAPRPFLKWAGGKAQILEPIAASLPAVIEGRYVEPFLGGGAVFFHLRREGRLRGPVTLSDANAALMETWIAVRDDTERLLDRLHGHREAHRADPAGHFARMREEEPRSATERAARFIYLNKTCFNGLWRVNRSGKFNVPPGRYRNPSIFDTAALRAAAAALAGVELRHGDWSGCLGRLGRRCAVYFDPPYEPVSRTANFTSYTKEGFTFDDQKALARACGALRERGVPFLLSNSDVEELRDLYRAEGLRVRRIAARRAINASPRGRGPVGELLVDAGPGAGTP